jgi:hypothetical protein
MIKITEILSKFFYPNEKNVSKNKSLIMDLLFNSEFETLTTQESIELFKSVKRDFEAEISQRGLDAEIETEDINLYFKENGK